MKRISFLLVTMALCGAPVLRAQDSATEERLNKLSGQIENIMEAQQALSKQIDRLTKEVESLRDKPAAPMGNYATQEKLDALVKTVAEVDRKRVQDAEKVKTELENIKKALLKDAAPASPKKKQIR